jgi:hypothetical protein
MVEPFTTSVPVVLSDLLLACHCSWPGNSRNDPARPVARPVARTAVTHIHIHITMQMKATRVKFMLGGRHS